MPGGRSRRTPAVALLSSLALAAALCTPGCAEPYRYHGPVKWAYQDLLAVCSLDGDLAERSPLTPAGDFWGVDRDCAEAVGETFQIDWESFGEQPETFTDATTPAELVVGGLLLVLGYQGNEVAEAMREAAPEGLLDRFVRLLDKYDLDGSEDAGEIWYQLLSNSIDELRYAPDIDAVMSYSNGLVRIGDITGENGLLGSPAMSLTVVQVAGSLVHEAAHDFFPGHVECGEATSGFVDEDDQCDLDREGAYGTQAWWLHDWTLMANPWLESQVISDGSWALFISCARIVERCGFEPCAWWEVPDCEDS